AFGKPTPYTHIYERYASGLTGMNAGGANLYPDADARARDIFARGIAARARCAGRGLWARRQELACCPRDKTILKTD
ncbi:MAG: hypothetical protein HOK11_08580, partial [Rhodospirillaceae bacterium]|nr:hypothetical protein [Rhodospirillaceae bacterium]